MSREGKGEMQAVIDERATAEQRAALTKILSDTVHAPLFKPIEYEVDIERTAHV